MSLKSIAVTYLLLLFSALCFAQNSKLYHDVVKLNTDLSNHSKFANAEVESILKTARLKSSQLGNDTLKANIELSAVMYLLKIGDASAAWNAANQALNFSLKANHYNKASTAVLRLMYVLNFQGLFDSTLAVSAKYQNITNKCNAKRVIMALNDVKATALLNLGKHIAAREIYLSGLRTASELNDTLNIINVYVNIGNTYSNTDSSIYWYKKCLNYDGESTKSAYAIALYQIGFTYYRRDDYLKDSALHYFIEASKRINDFPSPIYKGMVENAIGGFFSDKHEFTLALPHLQEAYWYVKNIEAPLADVLVHSLTVCHFGLKNLDSATYYLNEYKTRIEKHNDDRSWMHYYQIANSIAAFKAAKSGNDTCGMEIIRLRNKALFYAKKINDDRIAVEEIFKSIDCIKQLKNTQEGLAIKRDFMDYCAFFKPLIKQSERKIKYCGFLESYAAMAESIGDEKLQLSLYKELAESLTTLQIERYNEGQNEALIKYKSDLKDAEITSRKKINLYLSIAIVLLVVVILVIVITQIRTIKLNKKILVQKQELQEQKQNLEDVNKVKDRLFSVISHDMRTPLSSLLSYIQLLEHQNLSPEKMIIYTKDLKHKLFYTTDMMDNLLNWAHSQMRGYKPVNEVFDVKQTTQSVLEILSAEADRKQIKIVDNTSSMPLTADINMTTLIIRNLLSNAIKYTANGGEITISNKTQDGYKSIMVCDDGVGLTQDWISNFNAQETNNPLESKAGTNNEKGTGIGLMLCKSFAKLMNARVLASNNETKGACFTLKFNH